MYVQCRSSEGGGSEGGRYGVQVNGGGKAEDGQGFFVFFSKYTPLQRSTCYCQWSLEWCFGFVVRSTASCILLIAESAHRTRRTPQEQEGRGKHTVIVSCHDDLGNRSPTMQLHRRLAIDI